MAVILDNKVGDVTVYKVERLLNRISAAGFCAGLDLGVARDSLLAVTTLRAHRVADRSKLAGATLSNRVVLIRRRGPYTKKPLPVVEFCACW